MSRSILVVGGAGYVGSHMVKTLLECGHTVYVFDNLSRGHRDAVFSAQLVEGDLLDAKALRVLFRDHRFDAVMHFAALCYVGESVQRPRDYYRNNVVGSLNLLDAMLDAGANNLVFSSTCATYGNPHEVPMRENHPQRPINPYGASKLAVETALNDYARAHCLRSVSLRYFNAAGCAADGSIGERHEPETHLIPLILQEAIRVRRGGAPAETTLVVNGADYDTFDRTCIRDYIHVDDLASAHLSAMEALIDGSLSGASAYNLGTEKGFSVLEVIESARKVTGVPIQYRLGPRRPGDPPRLVANSDAAHRDLGWQPRYRDLDSIVATAWNWFSRQIDTTTQAGRCASSA